MNIYLLRRLRRHTLSLSLSLCIHIPPEYRRCVSLSSIFCMLKVHWYQQLNFDHKMNQKILSSLQFEFIHISSLSSWAPNFFSLRPDGKDNRTHCSDRFHLIFGSFFIVMRLNATDSYAYNNNKFKSLTYATACSRSQSFGLYRKMQINVAHQSWSWCWCWCWSQEGNENNFIRFD